MSNLLKSFFEGLSNLVPLLNCETPIFVVLDLPSRHLSHDCKESVTPNYSHLINSLCDVGPSVAQEVGVVSGLMITKVSESGIFKMGLVTRFLHGVCKCV